MLIFSSKLFRYIITVSDSCHVTLQLGTSKRNACFKLEVLHVHVYMYVFIHIRSFITAFTISTYYALQVIDGDSAIIQQEGCGHCVIPSLVLLPEEEKQDGEEIPLKKVTLLIHSKYIVMVLHFCNHNVYVYIYY